MNTVEKRAAYSAMRDRLWAITGGRCWYCGCAPSLLNDKTIDHVVSRNKGGSEHETNLVASCGRCNGSKGDLTLGEYRKWLGKVMAGWPKFTPQQSAWLRINATLPAVPQVVFYGEADEETKEDIASAMRSFWKRRYLRSSSIPPAVNFDHLQSHAQS